VTEGQLVAEILALVDRAGLLAHHCHDSRHCSGPAGFPDLVIAGPGGVIFREVKSEHGETSSSQDMWGYRLLYAAPPFLPPLYAIWRPADLESGLIRGELNTLGGTL
jgi:hypothetical protein